MGPDRRLVAYPCRRSQYLNIVAIVVRAHRFFSVLTLADSPRYQPDSEAEGSTEQWQVPGRPEQLLESFSAFCEDAKDILRCVGPLFSLRSIVSWTTRSQKRLVVRALAVARAGPARHLDEGQGHPHRRRCSRYAPSCVSCPGH